MTHTPQDGGPVMTLPNGETIREGEYGVTRDGRKVGPIERSVNGDKGGFWCEPMGLYRNDGTFGYGVLNNTDHDIIAKWHPVEAGPDPKAPNYSDGNWHGWNGGECPVHQYSVVEVRLSEIMTRPQLPAGRLDWGKNGKRDNIIAFRVITPYVEPAPKPVKPAKRDLRTIDEPFGELDERTQKRLRKAAKRGWPVQYRCSSGGWINPEAVNFWDERFYRIDPTFTRPPSAQRSG